MDKELSQPFDKNEFDTSALSFQTYSLRKWELLKACMEREWILMKRNRFLHVFKSAQVIYVLLVQQCNDYFTGVINLTDLDVY